MTLFYAICIFGFIYLFIRFDQRRMGRVLKSKSRNIKEPPREIQPISPSPDSFHLSIYTRAIAEIPETKDSWLSINEDGNILRKFARELDEHRQSMDTAAKGAIARFELDHAQLLDQQLQVYRRIYQSRKLLSNFEELRGNKLSTKEIPDIFRITIPLKPSYVTAADLQKKYSLPPTSNIATGLSRILSSNGGLLKNPNNLLMAAAAAAALALKAKSNNSKMKRLLESSRGSISNYGVSLMTTVEILSKNHPGLIEVSRKLKQSEADLIAMIHKIGSIDPKINKLEQLQPDIREQLQLFHLLLLKAEQYGKTTI